MANECYTGRRCESTSCTWNFRGTCGYDEIKDFVTRKEELINMLKSGSGPASYTEDIRRLLIADMDALSKILKVE